MKIPCRLCRKVHPRRVYNPYKTLFLAVNKLSLNHKAQEEKEYINRYLNCHLIAAKEAKQSINQKSTAKHLTPRQHAVFDSSGCYIRMTLENHAVINQEIVYGGDYPRQHCCAYNIGQFSEKSGSTLQNPAEEMKQQQIQYTGRKG